MARRVAWAERAARDLDKAAEYIARDSPVYAASLVRQAHRTARSLATLAERGRVVPEFEDSQRRELFVSSYRLLYRIADEVVLVTAFVHGARDLVGERESASIPPP
jgi:plasmid stabilization system protein ParE